MSHGITLQGAAQQALWSSAALTHMPDLAMPEGFAADFSTWIEATCNMPKEDAVTAVRTQTLLLWRKFLSELNFYYVDGLPNSGLVDYIPTAHLEVLCEPLHLHRQTAPHSAW